MEFCAVLDSGLLFSQKTESVEIKTRDEGNTSIGEEPSSEKKASIHSVELMSGVISRICPSPVEGVTGIHLSWKKRWPKLLGGREIMGRTQTREGSILGDVW